MNKPGLCYVPFGIGFGFFLIGIISAAAEQSKCAVDMSFSTVMMIIGLVVMLIGDAVIKTTPKTSEAKK